MLDTTMNDQVSAILTEFGAALAAGDVDGTVAMFQEDCYWRDLVTFTWNIKTVEGRDEVADMLRHQLAATKPSNWQIANGEAVTEEAGVVTAWITFETGVARGYGLIRLKGGKIWTLLTSMVALKGHEEPLGSDRPLGAKHGSDKHRPTWAEERDAEARDLGTLQQPEVLIIGVWAGRYRLGRAAAATGGADHYRREERPTWRQLAQPLQIPVSA